MKILVVGAGATGGWFGGQLALAGRDVTFLVRSGRAAVLRERGLRFAGVDDEVLTPRTVKAADLSGTYDVVLLAVTLPGLDRAVTDFASAVGPDTMIVPFLNGMAHIDTLRARFGDGVLGGVVRIAAKLGPDGEIVRLAPSASLTVGELDGTLGPRVEKLAAALDGAGFEVALSRQIVAALWHKWAFVAVGVFNYLVGATVNEIVAMPDGAEFGPALVAEAAAVSAAAGFPVPDADLALATSLVMGGGSSMAREASAQLRTEGESLLRDLVARARVLAVPVPTLELAIRQLQAHLAHRE
jgi:2-dehydropantoate 2-reductase